MGPAAGVSGRRASLVAIVILCGLSLPFASAWFRFPLDLFWSMKLELPGTREKHLGSPETLIGSSRVFLVDLSVSDVRPAQIVDRKTQAEILQKLVACGVWIIGMDIIYPIEKDGDKELEQALRAAKRVILANQYDEQDLKDKNSVMAKFAKDRGVAQIIRDSWDSHLRQIQHYYEQPGIKTPYSLSVTLARYLMQPPEAGPASVQIWDDRLVLQGTDQQIEVPFNDQGMSLIQYQGPAGTIPVVSWRQLIDLDPKALDLTGRCALLGNTRLDIQDAWQTPFHRSLTSKISGAEIHAQDLVGLLSGFQYRRAPDWTGLVLGVLLLFLALLLANALTTARLIAATLLWNFTLWFGIYQTFSTTGTFVNPLPAFLAGNLATALAATRRFWFLETELQATTKISAATTTSNLPVTQPQPASRRLDENDRRVPDWLLDALGTRYTRVAYLAAGGMGKVYRALDTQLGMDVAVKFPDETLFDDKDTRGRFQREIEALARMNHPNIVRLYDVSSTDPIYYSMELVADSNLQKVITKSAPLSELQALDLFLPITSAVASIHKAGIIHRDLKPSNVLMTADGAPKLADFGLAFLAERTRMTRSGEGIGTPIYMPPEQIQGESPGFNWDVYALGVMLFEGLTGQVPFNLHQQFQKMVDDAPPLTRFRSDLSPAFVDLVGRCLSSEAKKRPADAREVFEGLLKIADQVDPRRR